MNGEGTAPRLHAGEATPMLAALAFGGGKRLCCVNEFGQSLE